MKPITNSELIKKSMLDMIESVVENLSSINELIEKIEGIPISNNTATRRVEKLSGDVCEELKTNLKMAEHIELAIDESTNRNDSSS